MQDLYVGDIGDFGKYGLLRKVCGSDLTLAINWYKVSPKTLNKQNDGRYIDYLSQPKQYRYYDTVLFDTLQTIVLKESQRTICEIEKSGLLDAIFFSDNISINRSLWHQNALKKTEKADVVFLDPDNGLETKKMHNADNAAEKHVKWNELKVYYDRGQSVILYQHRPQMMKKEVCIKNVLEFSNTYLMSDNTYILEFPKYTNRFYFFFVHSKHNSCIKQIYDLMLKDWKGFCNQADGSNINQQ